MRKIFILAMLFIATMAKPSWKNPRSLDHNRRQRKHPSINRQHLPWHRRQVLRQSRKNPRQRRRKQTLHRMRRRAPQQTSRRYDHRKQYGMARRQTPRWHHPRPRQWQNLLRQNVGWPCNWQTHPPWLTRQTRPPRPQPRMGPQIKQHKTKDYSSK